MPNTAVKPANAESTWGEAPWEDRKPLIQKERIQYVCVLFLYMYGFLSFQVPGISSEALLKEQRDA